MSKLLSEGKLLRVLTIQPVSHHVIYVKTIGDDREPVLPAMQIEAWDHETHISIQDLNGELNYIVVIDQKGIPKIYDVQRKRFV